MGRCYKRFSLVCSEALSLLCFEFPKLSSILFSETLISPLPFEWIPIPEALAHTSASFEPANNRNICFLAKSVYQEWFLGPRRLRLGESTLDTVHGTGVDTSACAQSCPQLPDTSLQGS